MPDEQRPDRYDDAHEWRRATDQQITSLRGAVSSLETGQAKVQSGLDYLTNTVNNAVTVFQQTAKPKETQWGVLISLLALITIIAGGFTKLTTDPITFTQESNVRRIQALEDTDAVFAKFAGASEAWREGARRELDRLWEHAQQAETDHVSMVDPTAYARGRQDAYEGRLNRLSQRLEKLGERTYAAKP
ncbi:MAG: hypothetical protein WCT12_28580 [Verrucomicrobiota bacterium]